MFGYNTNLAPAGAIFGTISVITMKKTKQIKKDVPLIWKFKLIWEVVSAAAPHREGKSAVDAEAVRDSPSASRVLALMGERGSDPHPRRGSHCDSALIIALPQLQLEELIACYFWKLLTAALGCKSWAGLVADEFIRFGWIHPDCQDQIRQPQWWLMQFQRCSEMWIMKRMWSWKMWRGEGRSILSRTEKHRQDVWL